MQHCGLKNDTSFARRLLSDHAYVRPDDL